MDTLERAIEEHASPSLRQQLSLPEIKRAIRAALARLTEREQTVLGLYYFEAMTLEQVGQVLGVSEAASRALHTTAVLSLRAQLFALGGDMQEQLMQVFAPPAQATGATDSGSVDEMLAGLEAEGLVRTPRRRSRTPAASVRTVRVSEDPTRWVLNDRS